MSRKTKSHDWEWRSESDQKPRRASGYYCADCGVGPVVRNASGSCNVPLREVAVRLGLPASCREFHVRSVMES